MAEPTVDGWMLAKAAWGVVMTLIGALWLVSRKEVTDLKADIAKQLAEMEARQIAARDALSEHVETNRKETRDDFRRVFEKIDNLSDDIRSSTGNWPQQR